MCSLIKLPLAMNDTEPFEMMRLYERLNKNRNFHEFVAYIAFATLVKKTHFVAKMHRAWYSLAKLFWVTYNLLFDLIKKRSHQMWCVWKNSCCGWAYFPSKNATTSFALLAVSGYAVCVLSFSWDRFVAIFYDDCVRRTRAVRTRVPWRNFQKRTALQKKSLTSQPHC